MRKYHFLVAAAIVLLDQFSKWLVSSHIALHDSIVVIPGFFRLTHVQNRGAAFGLFDDVPGGWKIGVLILFSVVAMVVVTALLWKNSHAMNATGVGLALVLGGAMGNLWDRVVVHHVVDFLDFYLGTYHWPAFNIADSAIVVGALLLVSEILFAKTPGETKNRREMA
ncbi:MAG: signal peptidase II [Terriglobales bacterium]